MTRPPPPASPIPEVQARNLALLEWYDRTGRDLPWRRTQERWPILVSEVMLQQTQVARVEPVFRRFLRAYPTPAALAAAPAGAVVQAWEDLGYLRRARHLQAAARCIAADGWPADLTELPGVGRYTAAAVAAFAAGEPVAAVDVNLRRVLSRWAGSLLVGAAAEDAGTRTVDQDRPGDWNQAMMDLGSRLCRPRTPRCGECPVSRWCRDPGLELPGRRQGPLRGSVREARAAIIKRLAQGSASGDRLTAETGLQPDTVAAAIAALTAEGAIARDGDRLRLA